MSILTSLGVGSGVDTTELIKNLIATQKAPAQNALTAKQTKLTAQVSSLATVSSGLSAFSTALTSLVTSGALDRQVTSSDTTVLNASTADTGEPTGISASITVDQLATRQTVVSGAVNDRNAAVGQGTLTITLGALTTSSGTPTGFSANSAKQPINITIGSAQDSMAGVAQAINASGAGLTASIVADSNGSRLVIKGDTGVQQGFTISGTGTLSQFNFGPGSSGVSLTTEAKNAKLTVDGVAIERPSNSIDDVMEGVQLNLVKTSTSPVTVSSDFDTATISTSVGNYVGAYNQLWQMLADATKPGSSTTDAGPLASESAIRDLKNNLARLTSQALITDGGHPATLAEIGIKTNRDGTLTLDQTSLNKAIAASPERVHAMFVPGQSSGSSLVSITSTLGSAKSGSYAVTDLVPPSSGKLVGSAASNAFATPVVIDSSNSGFTVTLDGRQSLNLTLPEGSYADGASLAAAFKTAINNDSVVKSFGLSTNAGWDGSAFTFTSSSTSSSSKVVLNGLDGTLATRLGLDTAISTAGTSVSGKIAGIAAVGIGNRLTASSTSPAAGLALTVYPGASNTTITVRTTVSNLIATLQSQLSADGGGLSSTSARFTQEQTDITTALTKLNDDSTAMSDRLTTQFAAMEAAVASFKSTQAFLTQQVDAWNSKNN